MGGFFQNKSKVLIKKEMNIIDVFTINHWKILLLGVLNDPFAKIPQMSYDFDFVVHQSIFAVNFGPRAVAQGHFVCQL